MPAALPRRLAEAVFAGHRKQAGRGLLADMQNVDGKMLGQFEGLEAAGRLGDADEEQRWVERDGGEGVGREADRIAAGIESGHHGYACCETAERVAQGARVRTRAVFRHEARDAAFEEIQQRRAEQVAAVRGDEVACLPYFGVFGAGYLLNDTAGGGGVGDVAEGAAHEQGGHTDFRRGGLEAP